MNTAPAKGSLYEELDIDDPPLGIGNDRKWTRESSVDWEVDDFEETDAGELWYDYGDLSLMYTCSRERRGTAASRACVEVDDGYGADDPALQAFSFPESPSLRSPPAKLTSPYRTASPSLTVPLQRWTTRRQKSTPQLHPFVPVKAEYPDSLCRSCSSEHPNLVGHRDAPVVERTEREAQWSLVTVLLVCFAAQLVCFVVKGLLDF